MKKFALLLVAAVATAGCSREEPPAPAPAPPQAGPTADIVYTNGNIYTVNADQPWAEAVAIKDGKFLVVGSRLEVGAVTGDGTEVVDLSSTSATRRCLRRRMPRFASIC